MSSANDWTARRLWETSLLRLQQQFDALSVGGRVAAVLIQHSFPDFPRRTDRPEPRRVQGLVPWSTGGGPRAELRPLFNPDGTPAIGERPILDAEGKPMLLPDGRPAALALGRTRDYTLYVTESFDPHAVARLIELCHAAGVCLGSLPRSIKDAVWKAWAPAFLKPPPGDYWVNAVFELALQRHDGSPLEAEPTVWQGNWESSVESLSRSRKDGTAPFGFILSHFDDIPDPPRRWYALLENLALASTQAIDILLALARESAGTPALAAERELRDESSTLAPRAISKPTHFVYFRCWPGFTDKVPYGDFNHLPDAEAAHALRRALAVKLWQGRTAVVAQRRINNRQRPLRPSGRGRRPRKSPAKYFSSKEHRFVRLATLVDWQTGSGSPMYIRDKVKLFSPRVWLVGAANEDLARAMVNELTDLTPNGETEAAQRSFLNPRFGIVAADSLSTGELAAISASIARLGSGQDTSEWATVARPFVGVAKSIVAAWPTEFSPAIRQVDLPNEPMAVDLVTLDEIAKLAAAEAKTLYNIVSNKRKVDPMPPPVIAQAGSNAARYSYSQVRPWLLKHWPRRANCFPESYEEARKKLS